MFAHEFEPSDPSSSPLALERGPGPHAMTVIPTSAAQIATNDCLIMNPPGAANLCAARGRINENRRPL
jgi:hypothetical protein